MKMDKNQHWQRCQSITNLNPIFLPTPEIMSLHHPSHHSKCSPKNKKKKETQQLCTVKTLKMKDLLNAVSGVKIGVNDPILRDNQNTFIVSSKGVTGTNSFVLSNILPNDDCHVFCMTTFEDDFKKVSDKTVACAFALNLLFSHCKYVQSKLSEEIDVFAMKIYHFLSNLKITGPNISQKINLILMDVCHFFEFFKIFVPKHFFLKINCVVIFSFNQQNLTLL